MRYVIELDHDGEGGAQGTVSWSDRTDPVAFSGWLELLRLLERPAPKAPPASASSS